MSKQQEGISRPCPTLFFCFCVRNQAPKYLCFSLNLIHVVDSIREGRQGKARTWRQREVECWRKAAYRPALQAPLLPRIRSSAAHCGLRSRSHTTLISNLENTPINVPTGRPGGGIVSIEVQVDKQKPNQHKLFLLDPDGEGLKTAMCGVRTCQQRSESS